LGCLPLHKELEYNKVRKFSDSFGQKITLTYDRIQNIGGTRMASTTVDDEEVVTQIPSDIIAVSNVVSENSNLTYGFKEPQIHLKGKGFLGFGFSSITENLTNTFTTNTLKLNTDFYTLVPEKSETRIGGILVSQTIQDYSLIQGLNPKQYITRLNSTSETNFLTNTTKSKTLSDYDSYGNPKTIITNSGDGISQKNEFTYVQSGTWCPNIVATAKTTSTNGTETNVVEKNFSYYASGKLERETLNPNDTKYEIVKNYLYDSFGNLTNSSLTNGGIVRSTVMTYSTAGRYLKTKKDVNLNETTTYNYDEARDIITSETTQVGSIETGTTTYEYDGFNRLIKTKFPDKIETFTVFRWAGGTGPVGAKYYAYSEASGQSPVKVWYDGLSREIRKDFYGLNEKLTSILTEYNSIGQVFRVSEPYYTASGPSIWESTYKYDPYGRVEQITTPAGTVSNVYVGLRTTVTAPSGISETILNSAGQVITSITDGKKVVFDYYANGLNKSTTPEGGKAITYEYDLNGNRTKIIDPDAGIIESTFNGLGELIEEKQKIHTDDFVVTSISYLPSGLIDEIIVNGNERVVTKSSFDNKNRLKMVSIPGVNSLEFEYDEFHRPISTKETIEEKSFTFATSYDAFGRVAKETFPTGYYTTNQYDRYGLLKSVTSSKGDVIYEASEVNAKGQLKKYKQGGRDLSIEYDNKWNRPTSLIAQGIISMSYTYNNTTGNLDSRYDVLTKQKECFEYDTSNRLKTYNIYQDGTLVTTNSVGYEPVTGGISNKPFVGYSMTYKGVDKPDHALNEVLGIPSSIGEIPQSISYTDFNKVKLITQGIKTHQLTYGVSEQRIKGVFTTSGNPLLTRY
jgi:YD repeat-containing protein